MNNQAYETKEVENQPTILFTLVGTVVIFSAPSMLVFVCELASWKQKIQHWEESSTTFCQNVGTALGVSIFNMYLVLRLVYVSTSRNYTVHKDLPQIHVLRLQTCI